MKEKKMEIAINIYDEDSDHLNVIDSGVVVMEEEEFEPIVDLALEIAWRHSKGIDYEKFLDRLVEICDYYI